MKDVKYQLIQAEPITVGTVHKIEIVKQELLGYKHLPVFIAVARSEYWF